MKRYQLLFKCEILNISLSPKIVDLHNYLAHLTLKPLSSSFVFQDNCSSVLMPILVLSKSQVIDPENT
jgi:hypothetical protein